MNIPPAVTPDHINDLAELAALRQRVADLEQQITVLQVENEHLRTTLARLPIDEATFRNFFEHSQDGLILINDQGIIIEWSRGAEQIFGLQRTDTVGKPRWEVMSRLVPQEHRPPDLKERIQAETLIYIEYARHAADISTTTRRFESSIQRPDGSRCVIASQIFPIQASNQLLFGNITCDITARKQAEAALYEREAFYRAIFEKNLAVKLLIDPENGAIVDANQAAAAFYGYPLDTLRTMHIYDINNLPAERVYQEMQKALTEQRMYFEFRHRLPSGEIRDVEVYSGPVIVQDRILLFSIVHDITERKLAEDALRKLSRAIEHSSASVIITNVKGIIEYVNPYFTHLTGYTLAEAIGQSPRILKSGYTSPEIYAELWGNITRGKEWQGELYNRKKDGQLYWEHATIAPVFDEAGTITHYVAVKEDITARKQAEEALRMSEAQLQAIFDHALLGIGLLDTKWNYLKVNSRWADMLGYSLAEVYMSTILAVIHPDDVATTRIHQQRLAVGEIDRYRLEKRFVRRDGTIFWADALVSLIRNPQGKPALIIGTIADITERKQLEQVLQEQAIRDPLTGLYNRRYLDEMLPREVQRARRQGLPVGVVMLDIDHFKRFNDTYGHDAGDMLLCAVGIFLREHIRGEDIACRYGGEEFTLVLPGISLEHAQQRAEDIRIKIQALVVEYGGYLLEQITVSLGVAIFPNHSGTADGLLKVADQALYQAKKTGRDRVVIFSSPQ